MEFSYQFSSSDAASVAMNQSNFEMRTKFTVRRMLEEDDGDAFDCEFVDKECLSVSLSDSASLRQINYRLNEYSMPVDQIQTLLRRIIESVDPVAVDVLVCTLQKDGETICEAMDRSVRPEFLTPLDLLKSPADPLRDFLLYGLPRIRVGEEGFKNLMDACPICMCGPISGATVSILPCCRNAFHTHCVVRWLTQGCQPSSCPLCRYNSTNWAAANYSPTFLDLPAQRPRKRKRQSEDVPAQRPAKRSRQPSSWLKDYFVI